MRGGGARPRRALTTSICMLLCMIGSVTLWNTALAADPIKDIDVWINVTLKNLTLNSLNFTGIDQALLLERLLTLSQTSPVYADLAGAVVKAIETQIQDGAVVATACGVGSYTDPGTGLCLACPAGTYSVTLEATAPDVCVSCGRGKYSEAAGASAESACVGCGPGTYSGATGASSRSACVACQSGATTSVTSGATDESSCVCRNGFYKDEVDMTCTICGPGYYCTDNKYYSCNQRSNGASSSPEGSSRIDQCFCKPGYFGRPLDPNPSDPESLDYCRICPSGHYCNGYLVGGVAQKYECPANSYTLSSGSSSMDKCICSASYRKQVSDTATRKFRVDAARCMCTVRSGEECALPGGCNAGCGPDEACMPSEQAMKELRCPQGYVNLLASSSTSYSTDTVPKYWVIAPEGGTRVSLSFSQFNTKVGDNLTVWQCANSTCAAPVLLQVLSGDMTRNLPLTVKTDAGMGVMRLRWVTAKDGAGQGWKATYGINLTCAERSVALYATDVVFPSGARETPYWQPDATMPIVAWFGDTLSFELALPATSYVRVDVRRTPLGPSLLDPDAGLSVWMPYETGAYYVVDPSLAATRYRKLVVTPLEPTQWGVYYTVETTVAQPAFTLSGGMSGSNSPDIVVTVGDTLAMTRLTGLHAVMILSAYAGPSSYTLVTEGVVGQSSASEFSVSLTWDTTKAVPGVYYYASAASPADVLMGRVIVTPRPGGQQCVVCKPGEYCYDGTPLRCPANSNSPAGSTGQENCTCSGGYAREMTDMASYVNSQTVDSGGRHSCLVSEDGGLWCWGANEVYQLGLGRASAWESAPQRVDVSGVVSVALGDDFTCVVVGADLKTRCWGGNYYGQLGMDSMETDSGAVSAGARGDAILAGSGVAYNTRYLSCGVQSCCAVIYRVVAAQVGLTCWGRGNTGQLGRGSTKTSNIGTGALSGAGVRTSYTMMGSADSRPAFDPTKSATPVSVTMGGAHACALLEEGVQCWGINMYGALGIGSSTPTIYDPTLVNLGAGKAAKTVNCYAYVCCAVISGSFEVKCWGRGDGGRLGVGVFDVGKLASSMGANLQSVALGAAQYAMDVNVGSSQTCALLANNHVKCWGLVAGEIKGDNPPLDMYDLLPSLQLNGGRVALQISGKGQTTCAVLSDYSAACWGNNDWRQLGGSPQVTPMNMTLVNLSAGVGALRSSGTPQSLVCSQCSANYYCDGRGGPAARCPNNTVSDPLSFAVDQCKCLLGYASIGSGASFACRQCSGAEFCSSGTSSECPLFSTTLSAGAYLKTQCVCMPGFTGDDGGRCEPCIAGRYKSEYGSGPCQPCSAGTYSAEMGVNGSWGCKPCGPGTFSVGGESSCSPCGPGASSRSGSSICQLCGAGFFAQAGAEGCQPCPAGTFDGNPRDGLVGTCFKCPAGTASAALNATSDATCKLCPAGTVSEEGAAECGKCLAGQYSDGGTEGCTSCPANSNSVPGAKYQGCECEAGHFKDFSLAGNGYNFECTRCPAGSWSAANASRCTPCDAGRASSDVGATGPGVCGQCSAGAYAPAGSAACAPCPAWSFSASAGQGSCQNCSYGEWAAEGSASCSSCPAGSYSLERISSGSGCRTCPRGSYCVGSLAAKQSGVAQVQSCPLGTFVEISENGMTNAGQCRDCSEGSYCPTPTMKKGCPAGTISPAGSSSELQCKCLPGFVCSYTKVISAVVNLKMTLAQFNYKQVQDAFKQAVADVAKTSPSDVQIIKYVEVKPAAGGGARRRMLGLMDTGVDTGVDATVEKQGASRDADVRVQERGVEVKDGALGVEGSVGEIHVFLEVSGGDGDDLVGLDDRLVGVGLDPSLDHAWYSPHSVSVRKA